MSRERTEGLGLTNVMLPRAYTIFEEQASTGYSLLHLASCRLPGPVASADSESEYYVNAM